MDMSILCCWLYTKNLFGQHLYVARSSVWAIILEASFADNGSILHQS